MFSFCLFFVWFAVGTTCVLFVHSDMSEEFSCGYGECGKERKPGNRDQAKKNWPSSCKGHIDDCCFFLFTAP